MLFGWMGLNEIRHGIGSAQNVTVIQLNGSDLVGLPLLSISTALKGPHWCLAAVPLNQ